MTARRLTEPTLTPLQVDAAGRAELIHSTAWSRPNTPAGAHSSSRRQQVLAEPQPSSLAGNVDDDPESQRTVMRRPSTVVTTPLRVTAPAFSLHKHPVTDLDHVGLLSDLGL